MNVILVLSSCLFATLTDLGSGSLSSVQVHSDHWPLVYMTPQTKVKTLALEQFLKTFHHSLEPAKVFNLLSLFPQFFKFLDFILLK